MINRSFRICFTFIVTLGLACVSTPSFGQATNAAPTEAAPSGPAASTPVPAPPASPETAAANAPRPATYTLQAGDTLESIGKQWGLTGRQIQKYNHFTNKQVKRLQIGQVIKIPPATK